MSGRAGRSGRKPLSIVEHQLRGTNRRSRRHEPTLGDTPATVPEALLTGLGDDGRRFLSACYREWEVGEVEGILLTLAGRARWAGILDAVEPLSAHEREVWERYRRSQPDWTPQAALAAMWNSTDPFHGDGVTAKIGEGGIFGKSPGWCRVRVA